MKQSDIDQITNKILALNDDHEKLYEFLTACANAKAITENRINTTNYRGAIEASIKNMFNIFNKKG